MLAIGAQYAEFCPAHIHQNILPSCGLEDILYFQESLKEPIIQSIQAVSQYSWIDGIMLQYG